MNVAFEVYRASLDGRIVQDTTTRTLLDNEVFIKTTHSGVCGTDEHFLRSGQVLGHEGVGIVKKIGPSVKTVKIGDRVGFSYVHKVCGTCDNCMEGWDQYCRTVRVYGECDYDIGSFSHGTVWDADCVFPIPDGYRSEHAAPLMCAGATVWQCLHQYDVRPTQRVGVMGIGGLGHLAIKIAAAMGCHVVALSRSTTKRDDALKFGANEFHCFDSSVKDPEFEPLDHLLLCGSNGVDFASLMPIMNTNGTIYPLTATLQPTAIPLLPMNHRGVRIQGSTVASRSNVRSLLKYANEMKIIPTIEKFPLTNIGIEGAMQKLRSGHVKYRAVLEHISH